MKLNIIVANDFAHVNGGAAQVALSSAIGLSERGHDVTFLAAVAPVSKSLRESKVNVVLTGQCDIKNDPHRLRAATQGIWNLKSSRMMARLLEQAELDRTVIHVHGWTKALTSSIIRAALKYGAAVIVTLHDYFYACPNGGFFNFPKKECCHLRPLSAACLSENCDRDGYSEKLWRSARQVVQNCFGFRNSPLLSFITISDFSENILKDFVARGATTYRVNSPSDFEKEIPVDVSANSRFMSLGRLSPEKGLDLLARAALELNCDVTFVGEGPSRAEIQLVNPRAQITGWKSRQEVKACLRSARCIVLPSRWYEAQPMVIAEAAALGIPAIVADQCAGREMVENNVTGFWFQSGNWVDLRDKMALLGDGGTTAQMGRAAYQRHWKDPFTLEKHLDRLELCYGSALQNRRSKAH